jgi:hypothetical protein
MTNLRVLLARGHNNLFIRISGYYSGNRNFCNLRALPTSDPPGGPTGYICLGVDTWP